MKKVIIGDCELYLGDCLERMKEIPDGSVDLILADPPYGTTACKWDSVIPFNEMWLRLNKLIKPNGAIVLFGSEPFSSALRMSNIKSYKYDLVWDKTFGRQPQLANIQPMKRHENIMIFSLKGKKVNYYPQKEKLDKPYSSKGAGNNSGTKNNHKLGLKKVAKEYTHKTPTSVLIFKPESNSKIFHPTQKPVALMEYLIKTYTNEGELVLDFTMGSGTAGVAAVQMGRKFIGIEREPKYFEIACRRIEEAYAQGDMFIEQPKKTIVAKPIGFDFGEQP